MIQANRPDIVVEDKHNGTCLLINMSVPTDKNVSAKLFEKLSKYKDLEIEIENMWHLKTTTIPVVVGVGKTPARMCRCCRVLNFNSSFIVFSSRYIGSF